MNRRVKILNTIGATASLVTIAVVFVLLVVQVSRLNGRLTSQQQSAQANRVTNVATWCNAINVDRRVFRALDSGSAVTLPALPCQRIAHNTQRSARQ